MNVTVVCRNVGSEALDGVAELSNAGANVDVGVSNPDVSGTSNIPKFDELATVLSSNRPLQHCPVPCEHPLSPADLKVELLLLRYLHEPAAT